MALAHRLRERRERLSLTQEWVAQAMGIPRPLVSYWESGSRTPGLKHLQTLAQLYNTTSEYLLGESDAPEEAERQMLFRGLPEGRASEVHRAARKWMHFLDRWAEFQGEDLGRRLPGAGRPPKELDEGRTVTDRRRAASLAERVRRHYKLGEDALPDLYALLDENGFLVYKANLGDIRGEGGGVSGAFYNHPQLGFCILVNVDTSPGRQAFTLAHEVAHALFHHAQGAIICRVAPDDPLERFADAFAGDFLVPGRELRRMAKRERDKAQRAELKPLDAVSLANLFGVSYAMMLVRLRQERLVTAGQYDEWKRFSARGLAEMLGLSSDEFHIPEKRHLSLGRYPMSVLEEAKNAIELGHLSPQQVAGLLEVDTTEIQRVLLAPPPLASKQEAQEHDEFATT